MNIVQQANSMLTIILIILVVLAVVFAGLFMYLSKTNKLGGKDENINYNTFRRVDSQEYVKFKDIVADNALSLSSIEELDEETLKSTGMIVMDKDTFVGGIDVIGYNFFDASADEQQRTIAHALGFFNVVNAPIQLRQSVKAIDLTHNRDVLTKRRDELEEELYNMKADYNDLLVHAEDYIDNQREYESTVQKLREQQKIIAGKEFEVREANGVCRYIDIISGNGTNTQRVNNILFSYTYSADAYTQEQTDEEKYILALRELDRQARAYMASLEKCGCRCSRTSAEDLAELVRKHNHPVTAESRSIPELLKSSANALYITSDSLIQLAKQSIGEKRYEQQRLAYERAVAEQLRNAELQNQREYNIVLEDAAAQAEAELNAEQGEEV